MMSGVRSVSGTVDETLRVEVGVELGTANEGSLVLGGEVEVLVVEVVVVVEEEFVDVSWTRSSVRNGSDDVVLGRTVGVGVLVTGTIGSQRNWTSRYLGVRRQGSPNRRLVATTSQGVWRCSHLFGRRTHAGNKQISCTIYRYQ